MSWVVILPARADGQVLVIGAHRASPDLPGMISIRGRAFGRLPGLRDTADGTRLRFDPDDRAYSAIVLTARVCLPEQLTSELVMTARSDLADAMVGGRIRPASQPARRAVQINHGRQGCRVLLSSAVIRAIDVRVHQARFDAEMKPRCPKGTHESPVRVQAPASTLIGHYLQRISKRHGVELRFRFTDDELNRRMPWAGPLLFRRIGCPASGLQATFALGHIDDALERYPGARIREVLDTVYIASRLWLAGDTVSGLYGTRTIVVKAGVSQEVEGTVHHEVSSLLMHRWPFPWTRWRASRATIDEDLCGPIRRAPLKPHRRPPRERLARNGLVRAYGCTNAENDFNTYAEVMFTKPEEVLKLAARHRRVSQKLRLACGFYRSIGVGVEVACGG